MRKALSWPRRIELRCAGDLPRICEKPHCGRRMTCHASDEECFYRRARRDLDDFADGVRRHDSLRRTPTAYSARARGDADLPACAAGRLHRTLDRTYRGCSDRRSDALRRLRGRRLVVNASTDRPRGEASRLPDEHLQEIELDPTPHRRYFWSLFAERLRPAKAITGLVGVAGEYDRSDAG